MELQQHRTVKGLQRLMILVFICVYLGEFQKYTFSTDVYQFDALLGLWQKIAFYPVNTIG